MNHNFVSILSLKQNKRFLQHNNKKYPQHLIFPIFLSFNSGTKERKIKYANNRIDWANFKRSIIKNPFNPFCYSSINFLLQQRYDWCNKLFNDNVTKITSHRANSHPGYQIPRRILVKNLKFFWSETSKSKASISFLD